MRSWSTFKVRAKWGDIQNKPSVLVDNQIDWNEIQNKPIEFNPIAHNHSYLTLRGQGDVGLDLGNVRLSQFQSDSISSHLYLSNEFNTRALNIQFDNSGKTVFWGYHPSSGWNRILTIDSTSISPKISFVSGLPSNATGLASGTIWCDSSGYLRAA